MSVVVQTPIGVTVSSNAVSTLDFGLITITPSGQSGTLSVTFSNQSGAQITSFALSFATTGSPFTAAAPSLTTLNNGQSDTVQLTFTGPGDVSTEVPSTLPKTVTKKTVTCKKGLVKKKVKKKEVCVKSKSKKARKSSHGKGSH